MDENKLKSSMSQALEHLTSEIATIRTGRATPALVENLEVMVYGGTQKLRIMELASITVPDPQTIVVSPWDKSIIGEIKKGIESLNVGFNPAIDGEIIRISLPALTGEDRERYVKLMMQKLEEGRISIRKVRGDAMHQIKKSFETKEITEDQKFKLERRLQEITDEFVKKIDEAGERKRQELLGN
ncbi:ribosome recycling factor [Candidatus Woesebacteria bacterium]|nr:ribosome recycling factor [Candidatus Woesebacteria bacterium]QQG47392.1 MAG: ribosome recycling factor [Candidatus Woesebacteria bacterium]